MLRDILKTIDDFKEYVPEGLAVLKNANSMDIKQLLSTLNELFDLEENAIKKENSKPFVTNTYENNVKYFATKLIRTMVLYHNKLKGYEAYRKLLGQRHVSYGFYSTIDNRAIKNIKEYQEIIGDSSFERRLYLGLIEFYQNFYGNFSDNEEAIKLICQFYPKDVDLSGKADNIVTALFHHITNAGTPSDFGFAYKGIELIKKNICNFPIEIIDKLLQKYEIYRIINEEVYRHQIFTIIENSIISNKKKLEYKFSYLDSLLLANYMNRSLYEKYGNDEPDLVPEYHNFKINLSVKKIGLINNSIRGNTYAYWTNECSVERNFVLNEKIIFSIYFDLNNENIVIKYNDKPTIMTKFEFNYVDWMLNSYHSKESEQKLRNFVFEIKNEEEKIVYNNLTFSLVYLSNYRGVSEQLVDFDHKFTYDKDSNELMKSSIESPVIPHFYGQKIYSLSCIVGKNGTGKTSTVDFLRGTFFKLLRLIGEYGIACENGYVSEKVYEEYSVLDKGCEFFVVFNLGSQPYYLTNIENTTVTIARPFSRSDYKSVNELSKIVYFSNMLSVSQDNLYKDEGVISRHKSTKEELAESLNNFRQSDYSEAASFIQKQKVIDTEKQKDSRISIVNKDLCYQLAFLGYLTQEKLKYHFDMPEDKEFTLNSVSLGERLLFTASYSLEDMIGGESQRLKRFIKSPDSKLEYFSSGQYAKFTFLAKLYWFLEGYQKYIKDFESIIDTNNVFSRDDVLLDGETALIFIDEGELYYHPEWQRSYIKTLVDYIREIKIESKLQVVITTNSPFIISDILSEDITYLSNEKKEFDRTLGQNIHKLLKDNFFMSYTIGEYSREVIENIMKWLYYEVNEDKLEVGQELSYYFGKSVEPKEYYEKIRCLIDKIGESIYREKLLDMLRKSEIAKISEVERLLREKSEIERKLEEIKGKVKV